MPRHRRAARPSPPPPLPPEPKPPPEGLVAEVVEVINARGRQSGSPELMERRKVVRALVALGVTRHQLADAMGDQGWIVSGDQARRDYEVVLREWSEDYEADRTHTRAAQIRRLQTDLPRLRRDKLWKRVAAHELLLARIQGNFASACVQVEAHLTLRESLVATITRMSPEELDAIAAEQMELEGLAVEARRWASK